MKILVGHNQYQSYGGEDAVALAEVKLLKDKGEDVHLYSRTNAELKKMSVKDKTRFLWYMGWADQSYQDIKYLIKKYKPEVAHFHNIYFMMSPAVYYACQDQGVPVVQSLHNFRPLCANGLFFRNNQVCEKCLNGSLFNGVVHRCYQNSLIISGLVVRLLKAHRKMDTWKNRIDAYITATDFTKQKYISAGFDAEKIFVKPNFLYPSPPRLAEDKGYALYVGRLSDEKGVEVMIKAWRTMSDIPLKIAGDGPLRAYLSGYIHNNQIKNVQLLGHIDQALYEGLMEGAKVMILPSICYENFPRVAAEALAYGIPVIASRLGSLQEIINDQENGYLFEPGNSVDLVEKVKMIYTTNKYPDLKKAAYNTYLSKFEAEKNYQTLVSIYNKAIALAKG